MNYNDLFERAAQLVWRHKFMWLLGMLIGINSTLFGIVRLAVQMVIPESLFTLETLTGGLDNLPTFDISPDLFAIEPERLFLYLAGGTTAVFIWAILFWILVTVSEGALIGAVRDAETAQPVRFGTSLKAGWRWLGRFAAVDALVFLPWFIFTLVMMVIGIAGMFYLFSRTIAPNANLQELASSYLISLLCLFPVMIVMGLLSKLTIWYRTLAFRDAALLDHDVKTAVSHPFHLIKANVSGVIGVTALLWGVATIAGWGITAVSLFSTFALNGRSPFIIALDLAAILLIALLKGALAAFTAAAWTLAYREWAVNNE